MTDELNEKAPSGANRYYMHAQAHDQATLKYKISAKTASPDQAKAHRKLGKLHSQISAALNQIAGVHTSSDFSRSLKKKQESMANKKMNEGKDNNRDEVDASHIKEDFEGTNMSDAEFEDQFKKSVIEEEDFDPIAEALEDMVGAIIDREPGAFAAAFSEMMALKALDRIEELKIAVAQSTYDEVQEEVEEIDEISAEKLDRYTEKSMNDRDNAATGQFFTPNGKKHNAERKKWSDRFEKRDRGINKAQDKLTGKAKVLAREEVEQVDEVSAAKLGRYGAAAMNGMRNSNLAIGRRDGGDPWKKMPDAEEDRYHKSNKKEGKNREKGIRTALDKLTGKAKVLAREEVEQVDELSKKTLGSYIKKAAVSSTDQGHDLGKKRAEAEEITRFTNRNGKLGNMQTREKMHQDAGVDQESQNKNYKKLRHRIKGIDRATDRLTKD